MNGSSFIFATVILAAGSSSRMGQPKLLLPWRGTSIVGHLLSEWKGLGAARIVVVTAAGDEAIERELNRLRFPRADRIRNNHPEQGMFSSVRSAAAWTGWPGELNHFVVSLGDQPHVKQDTLQSLLQFAVAHQAQVCQPAFHGHPRHPVVLPRHAFLGIGSCREQTLKQYLSGASVALCHSEDEGLDLDLDRPEDYARALKLDMPKPC